MYKAVDGIKDSIKNLGKAGSLAGSQAFGGRGGQRPGLPHHVHRRPRVRKQAIR